MTSSARLKRSYPAGIRPIWQRLNRARDRIDDFGRVEAAFLAREPYSTSLKFNSHTREYSLWVHVRERPPVELSLILSECVHHMRAALDNSVTAIALRQGAPTERSAMPVCLMPEDWCNRATQQRVKGLSAPVLAALQELQPFQRADDGIFGARYHPLYFLDALWNADKHRTIAFTLGSATKVKLSPDRPVSLYRIWPWGFDKDRAICRFRPRGWTATSPTDLQYNRQIPFRVGFGDDGPYQSGLIVALRLRDLYQFVRYEALPKLRPFL